MTEKRLLWIALFLAIAVILHAKFFTEAAIGATIGAAV